MSMTDRTIATAAALQNLGHPSRYRIDALMPAPVGLRAVLSHEGQVWEHRVIALAAGRANVPGDPEEPVDDESHVFGIVLTDDATLEIVEGEQDDGSESCFCGYRFATEGTLEDWIAEHAVRPAPVPAAWSKEQKSASARVERARTELREALAAFASLMHFPGEEARADP